MKIVSDFPGGNILVLSVTDTVVDVKQDLKGTGKWWFYWCFRVDDAPEGEVTFNFHHSAVVCPHGPATSADGVNWTRCEDGYVGETCFKFTFKKGESRYFSFSIPYVVSDFDRFYAGLRGVERAVLCRSEDGRDVPYITFGGGEREIFLTARHHCCESTGSYVLEGLIRCALDSEALMAKNKFYIFPFVDIDGVEKGEQGKDRDPHDHNRDYTDEPIYVFTRALRAFAYAHKPTFFIDLHSPWRWGGDSDIPHVYLSLPTPEQDCFVRSLVERTKDDTIRYGGRTYPYSPEKSVSSKHLFSDECHARLAVTVETPYAGDRPAAYTADDMRFFGVRIAQTLESM